MVTNTFGIALAGPLTLPSPPMGERDPRGKDSSEKDPGGRDFGEADHSRDQSALLSLRGGGVAPKAPIDLDVAEESCGILVEVEEGISPAIKDTAAPLGERGPGTDHPQDRLETIKGAGAGMLHADCPGAPGAPIPAGRSAGRVEGVAPALVGRLALSRVAVHERAE